MTYQSRADQIRLNSTWSQRCERRAAHVTAIWIMRIVDRCGGCLWGDARLDRARFAKRHRICFLRWLRTRRVAKASVRLRFRRSLVSCSASRVLPSTDVRSGAGSHSGNFSCLEFSCVTSSLNLERSSHLNGAFARTILVLFWNCYPSENTRFLAVLQTRSRAIAPL